MPKVVISERVAELIKDLRRDEVKAASFLCVKDAGKAFDSFNKLNAEGLLSKDLTISSEFGYVFEGLESDVIQRLESIPKRRRGTPRCVMVRMISSRLIKIHRASPGLTKSSLDTDSLAGRNIVYWTEHPNSKRCRKAASELIKILERDDITQEIIDDAWNQLLVWITMEE
jgi:hypothetical protein